MYSKSGIIFISIVAAASAGILAIPSVQVLQGPGSKTTLVGPDGSALSSSQPGGTVSVDANKALIPAGPAVLAASPEIAVRGPAGAILTSYTAAGPAVVPAVVPALSAGPAVLASPAAVANFAVGYDGDDHSGDYVPEASEKLYDDGSYKGDY